MKYRIYFRKLTIHQTVIKSLITETILHIAAPKFLAYFLLSLYKL